MLVPGVGLAARGVGLMSKLVGKFGSRAFTAVKNPSIKARRLLGDQTKAQYPKKQGLFNKKVPYKTKDYNSKADAESALKASKFDRKQEIVKSGTWRDKKGKMRSTWAIVPTRTSMMTSGKTAGLVGLGGLTAAGLSNYEGIANPAAVNAGADDINKGNVNKGNVNKGKSDKKTVNPDAMEQAKNEGMSKDTALGLMAMGAKMMQTKRPDALGVTGEGLGAFVDQSVLQRGLATDATTAKARVRANEIAARQNKLTAMTAVQKSLMTARSKAQDTYGKTIMALIEGIPGAEDQKAAIASSRKVHDLKIVIKDLDTQLENLRKQFVDYGVNIGGAPQQVAGATGGSNLGGRAEITRA
jgi:hypothetical protein